jgi:hypothetical protein
MEATMMFLDCPAYLDQSGAARCGLPAEVRSRFTMRSTDGPLESLIWERTDKHDPGTAAVASTATSARLTGSHDGRTSTGGSVIQYRRAGAGNSPPNTAPAYDLGRPASVWITDAGAASAPVPACTADPNVPPIRALLTMASAPAVVRN